MHLTRSQFHTSRGIRKMLAEWARQLPKSKRRRLPSALRRAFRRVHPVATASRHKLHVEADGLACLRKHRAHPGGGHNLPREHVDSEVFKRAKEVLESERAAKSWLTGACLPSLRGRCPAEAVQTASGRKRVLNILGQLEHGVFS